MALQERGGREKGQGGPRGCVGSTKAGTITLLFKQLGLQASVSMARAACLTLKSSSKAAQSTQTLGPPVQQASQC